MQMNEISSKMGEIIPSQAKTVQQQLPRAPNKKDSFLPSKRASTILKKEDMEKVVDTMQGILDKLNVRIVFSIHDKTGEVVVKVIDPKTNEVIKQIPPEEILKLQEKLDELAGILFDARA